MTNYARIKHFYLSMFSGYTPPMQPNQDNRSTPSGRTIAQAAAASEEWAFNEYIKACDKYCCCEPDPPETEETLP